MGCLKGDYLWCHLVAKLMVGNLGGMFWKTVHWSTIAQLHYQHYYTITCRSIMQHLQGIYVQFGMVDKRWTRVIQPHDLRKMAFGVAIWAWFMAVVVI